MEIWKTAIYNGEVFDNYEVSNMGNVRNAKTGRIRKPVVRKDGYLQIGLNKNGQEKKILIHRLVAVAFIENDNENKTEVNHIDEDKTNNCVENLEWCDRSYNVNHGTRNERVAKRIRKAKSKKVMGKSLTENKVIVFKSTQQAQRFGFSAGIISQCCNGKRKHHKGYTWSYID